MSAAYEIIPTPDWASTTTITIAHGSPSDPMLWARNIFGADNAPLFVKAMFAARVVAAKILRLPQADRTTLAADRVVGDEAIIDTDEKHLRFVAAIRPDPATGLLHVVTAVKLKGIVGRIYFAPVSLLHDTVTRSMMKSAAARLA